MSPHDRIVRAAILFACLGGPILTTLGCGDGTAEAVATSPATGPHGGPLAPLPGDKGFAEVLIESASAGKGGGGKERVVAYFLEKDLRTPIGSPLADVAVKLRFPDAQPLDVPLTADPKTGESTGAGRFASKPGAYAVDRPIGELSGTIDGQPFTGSFAAAR